jgi:hypothetical protein
MTSQEYYQQWRGGQRSLLNILQEIEAEIQRLSDQIAGLSIENTKVAKENDDLVKENKALKEKANGKP